jgi:hypothetical protein
MAMVSARCYPAPVQTEAVDRVIALKVDPAVVAICNGELGARTRIVAARDAHAACRMIASGGAVVVIGRATPFWDSHVVRDHAERRRMPVLSVAGDALPFELAREVEAAVASVRRRRVVSRS